MLQLVVALLLPILVSAQAVSAESEVNDKDAPAEMQAELITGRPDREISLQRATEITRGSTTVTADQATYNVVDDEVDASGNVCVQRFGDRYNGNRLKLKLDAGQGFVTAPTYRLKRSNAQGQAQRIDFESEDQATIKEGTYSTCEGPDPDWYLKSDTLRLDRGRDIGYATSPIVYFMGAPILYMPAISFALSPDSRKSGFLPPSFGTTSNGGFEFSLPYYLNIAPNRDLTLYPNWITRRGLQMGGDGRYLEPTYSGETRMELLLDDHQTGNKRYAVTSTHVQTLAPGLSMAWNLNAASDDDYPNDFSRSITASSQRLLLRDLDFNYSGSYWRASARASDYQVLQDPAAPITKPYARLPQLTFQVGRQDVMGGFDWAIDTEATNFWHADLPRGERVVVNPTISYPVIQPGFFITPKLSFDLSEYRLTNQAPGAPTELSRALPTFSLDGGLVFERDAHFLGEAMTQTLEPRLFYVNTPYHDQSLFPNFDSADADLSFAQFFSENRFIGRDRIGDANQLTTALTSRFLESSGAERMRFAVGQRFYFSDQRVSLNAVNSDSRSDLLLSALGNLSATLSIEGNLQYSESGGTISQANYGVHWHPAPKKVLNLQYRRDPLNSLEQLDMSAQWPIADRWYAVGRLNYSLPNSQVVEGLLGAEYKADCWVFRFGGQRTPTATNKATTSIFFQLELNGLAGFGSNNPLQALRASIPGYQKVNQVDYPQPHNP